jgi:hypothetical protein
MRSMRLRVVEIWGVRFGGVEMIGMGLGRVDNEGVRVRVVEMIGHGGGGWVGEVRGGTNLRGNDDYCRRVVSGGISWQFVCSLLASEQQAPLHWVPKSQET